MENGIVEWIQTAFFAFVFAFALGYMISSVRTELTLISKTKEISESTNKVMYEHSVPDNLSNGIISRNELVSRMMHNLEYPVTINGLTFLPENYHYINFDYSTIADGEYQVTNVYDTKGNLSFIRFDKI